MRRAPALLSLLVVTLLAVACGPATAGPTAASSTSPGGATCAGAPRPATYDHVVVVWLENRSYAAVAGSSEWPAVNALAGRCASARQWAGATHPSLPNYLAAASGDTGGVHSDCGPLECPQHRPSVFGAVTRAHLAWRTYAGGLQRPGCQRAAQGSYAPKHLAALYFDDARGACASSMVPLTRLRADAAGDRLPAYADVVPDLCDDGHDCPSAHADEVAGRVIGIVTSSPSYRAGRTALLVTFDEGQGGTPGQRCSPTDRSCRVLLVAASRSVRAGAHMDRVGGHADLARLTEDLLGLPHLAATGHRAALRSRFGL